MRGARNYPCQEFPGQAGTDGPLCRDPRGYVPVGTNPWRGPPIPYGTPVTNGLNVLPPNKFPYIPPGADPDPGTPIVGPPPPGVVPGPGPAAATSRPTIRRRPTQAGRDGRQRVDAAGRTRRSPPQIPYPEGGCRRRRRRKASPAAAVPAAGEAVGPAARRRRRRPTARPTPPMTKAPELSRTPQEALVSSRPAQRRIQRRELGGPDA